MSTYVNEDSVTATRQPLTSRVVGAAEASGSAVSWAAIFAGAVAAAALSLVLFILGIGLGLSSISAWSGQGADGETIGWASIAWLAFIQLASAGLGGYLAGRLRTKWVGLHTDEVYFRDTAHGFLAWALATVMMAALAGSVAGSAVSGTVKAASGVVAGAGQALGGVATAAGSAAQGALANNAAGSATEASSNDGDRALSYWVDSLLRKNGSGPAALNPSGSSDSGMLTQQNSYRSPGQDLGEITTIFLHALQTGTLSEADAQYVGSVVARNTGLSENEARTRVADTFAQIQDQRQQAEQKIDEAKQKAQEVAEQARKATAYSMLWTFIGLMIGAFFGALCATFGGRQRDL